MKGLKIRRVNEKDVLSLVVLAEEFIKNADYELIVTELEIGLIDQWSIHDLTHGGKHSYIQNRYVAPRYRKKSTGSKLLREIINTAKKKGVFGNPRGNRIRQ